MSNREQAGLTNRQAEALIKLRDHGPRCAYPGIYMGTLNTLRYRGLVTSKSGLGAMAMPHTSIVWTITPAGRAALTNGDGK